MTDILSIKYKGIEYDISEFINTHPGGKSIIEKYIAFDTDITQVFKAIHSKEAEKQLQNLKIINSKIERSKHQKIYIKIQQRVSKLYSCSYTYEITIFLFLIVLYALNFWINEPLTLILQFTIFQVVAAWIAHSQLHSHIPFSQKLGKLIGRIILGLSVTWWKQKHNTHHIFTNNESLDPDIKHNYRTILFPLLLFKWRIESLFYCLKTFSFIQILSLAIHYYLMSLLKLPFILVGELIASFYICVVVFGNHQQSQRYKKNYLDDFITHQIATTVNYDFPSKLTLLLFGGFQYHCQHHLFPQIPFYQLSQTNKIVIQQLQIYKKSIKIQNMI